MRDNAPSAGNRFFPGHRKGSEGEKFVIRGAHIKSNAVIEFAVQSFPSKSHCDCYFNFSSSSDISRVEQSSNLLGIHGLKRDKMIPAASISLK